MPNMTKIELQLISNAEICLFFEKGMRGRVSISTRSSKINNKYSKSYDPKHESKHIIYFDKYNL